MKKTTIILALCVAFVGFSSICVSASFIDETSKEITVKQALNMPDNTYIKLKGNIQKRLTDDKYLFTDKTGSINIEIDNDKWLGQNVKSGDLIEISGEIDKEINSTKIDVETIKVLPKK